MRVHPVPTHCTRGTHGEPDTSTTRSKETSAACADFTVRSYRRMPSMNLVHMSSNELGASASLPLLSTALEEPSPSIPLNALPTLPELPAAPLSPRSSAPAPTEPSAALPGSPDSAHASSYNPAAHADDAPSWSIGDFKRGDTASSLGLIDPTESTPGASPTAGARGGGAAGAKLAASPDANSPDAGTPELQQIKHGLSTAAVSTAVSPVLVPVGKIEVASRAKQRRRASDNGMSFPEAEMLTQHVTVVPRLTGGERGGSAPGGQQVVALHAVGTEGGSLEVVATAQGSCRSLALTVLRSFKVLPASVYELPSFTV